MRCTVFCGWVLGALSFLSSAHAEETITTYTYGRFTVEAGTDRQRVIGGEFTPPPLMPQLPSQSLRATGRPPEHVLFVNYVTKELLFYRRTEAGTYRPVIGYAVVTPEADFLPQQVVRGVVRQVVERPTWCPKVGGQVRRMNPTLPPGCLPYGHPQNPMGDYRFDIAWDVRGWELVRLHGTTGYPRGNFWDEETFGCTRLENHALAALLAQLGPTAVADGIEIIAHREVSLAFLAQ